MAYFPMYVQLEKCPCLIVGGGKVALRKVKVLQDFGAEVTVIAPAIMDEIRQIAGIQIIEKQFEKCNLQNMELVVAATDDAVQNHEIAELCKAAKIPVNAVDQVEDCTFIFPSYVKQGEVTVAITSGGQSPVITQYMKRKIEEMMPENLGEMADALGSIREQVKASLDTEVERKQVYATLLEQMLEQDEMFTESDVKRIIERYMKPCKIEKRQTT